jgi:hypothetical protein
MFTDAIDGFKKSHPKAVSFFRDLLNKHPKGQYDLVDLHKRSIGDVLYRQSQDVCQPTFNVGDKPTIVDGAGPYVAERLVHMYLKEIRNLSYLITAYSEDYTNYNHIWRIYQDSN